MGLEALNPRNGGHVMDAEKHAVSRREFVKKAAYVAPAIATFAVTPAYAKNGSNKKLSTSAADSQTTDLQTTDLATPTQ
jgi:hypothetical protein